jgi:glycosyltransferase involved in cell wall biosynthesis
MTHALTRLCAERRFDIAVLEGVHLGGYHALLRSVESRPAIVCDWHNVESEILERYSKTARGPHRRFYAKLSASRLESYERWFVNQCDMHVVVSSRDRDTLIRRYGATVPVVVIENGVPLDRFVSRTGEDRKRRFRVLFTGAMDYHANVEAAVEFATQVWPDIRAAAPQTVFTVVGRNPAPAVRALAAQPGIEVTGTVEDVRPYYQEALAAVVPLRVGGGTRIKILEAMAARVPVVATSMGAEGLAAIPGRHYILADSAAEMRAALTQILQVPARAEALSDAAQHFIRERHDWAALGDQLAEHLLGLISARQTR